MYVSVILKNVNLHSRSGTQASLIHAIDKDVDGGQSCVGGEGRQCRKCKKECLMQQMAGDSDRKHILESLYKPGIVLWAPTKPVLHSF